MTVADPNTRQDNPDVQLVRDLHAALQRGDLAWLEEHFADDIVWHVGGNSKWAGARRGKAELREHQARMAQATSTSESAVHDILGSDEHVVVLGSVTATAENGSSAEWSYVSVFHIDDGKITEVWGMTENDAAVDPFLDRLPD
ncbi:MAG TPA: nuclear transport factor 2 family protein [Nocardioidaceae bacterium]|nr:nuclear transport factor 2 family protein [Nocardioidaceae bacterium]